MAYALSYKSVRDKTTLYATIQDRETNLFWDENTDTWVDTLVPGCYLTLTESSDKGVYTGSATFTPVNGGIYQISIFDSADADYQMDTIEVYPPKTDTVISVIQAVQQELRMPQSSAITDSLSKLILAKMNTVLLELLPDKNIYDHLKVQGSFTINTSRQFYRVNPVNVDGVDKIIYLRRPDDKFIDQAGSDVDFREKADTANRALNYNVPDIYRIFQRDNDFPIVEFNPPPDQSYIVSYEIQKTPKKLTLATEFVPKANVIKAGALMLMKHEQGRDVSMEAQIFQKAMERCVGNGANSYIEGDFKV